MNAPVKMFSHVPFQKDGDEYFLTGLQIATNEDLRRFYLANDQDFEFPINRDAVVYIGSQDPDELVYEISPNGGR